MQIKIRRAFYLAAAYWDLSAACSGGRKSFDSCHSLSNLLDNGGFKTVRLQNSPHVSNLKFGWKERVLRDGRSKSES